VTLSGKVVNEDGSIVKKAYATLWSNGKIIFRTKTGGNGKFLFKFVIPGKYVLQVYHKKNGAAEMALEMKESMVMNNITLNRKINLTDQRSVYGNSNLDIIEVVDDKDANKNTKSVKKIVVPLSLTGEIINSEGQIISAMVKLSKGDGTEIYEKYCNRKFLINDIDQGYYKLILSNEEYGIYENIIHVNNKRLTEGDSINMGKIILK